MSTADFGENEYLDAAFVDGNVFGGASGANIYIALSTTAPNDDGTNFTEPSGNGYARVQHSANATTAGNWTAASGGQTSNNALIDFGTATGSWGTITHFGIYDASTAGNLVHYGALSASKSVATDDQVQFSVGNLDITAD